jgi:indole-3-glycerol phosphate synthase
LDRRTAEPSNSAFRTTERIFLELSNYRTIELPNCRAMNILDAILQRTRSDVRAREARVPRADLEARCRALPAPRDFAAAIRRQGDRAVRRVGPIRVIAEVKQASPSKGVIRPAFAPVDIARSYAAAGAHAISVLTDEPFFQGHLDHLAAVRQAVRVPVLRKDFHVDPYQLWEARAIGADAVLLLVAAAVAPGALRALLALSRDLGLAPLVEAHTREELDVALGCGARLIGINNRNLADFTVSLETTFRLVEAVPEDAILVSESGISEHGEVERLAAAGVDAILVGEGLLRHTDVGGALARLVGTP